MSKFGWMTKACGIFLLWAAAAVALPAQTFTTLYSFDGRYGDYPYASMVQGSDGNFYGTTADGGANDVCGLNLSESCGTVFKITPSGTLTTIHSFDYTDGASPFAGLVLGTDGNFYGTTPMGGTSDFCDSEYGCGTIFRITPSGTLTTLYSFCSVSDCADGGIPEAGLVQGADGDFYGTTIAGGPKGLIYGYGTVFKITQSGTLTTLHSFDDKDGDYPGTLIQATNGDFYGTTNSGGTDLDCQPNGPCGTVFKITSSGTFTTLHNFDNADGSGPGNLVQGTDGNLYGTTEFGGTVTTGKCAHYPVGCGTVFKITPSGTLTTLYNFCSQGGSSCPDGFLPRGGLVQGTDGNFYGTTNRGGANTHCYDGTCGTLFSITPGGTLTTLHSFDGTDGSCPAAAPAQGTNGQFYGTTPLGGANGGGFGDGTVFSLSVGLKPFVETVPTSGTVGTAVNILGSNLAGATSVTFNGTAAVFTVVSKTLITTVVPAGATTGTVEVVRPNGKGLSNVPFTVLQ